jgi:SulP family sulfate permease
VAVFGLIDVRYPRELLRDRRDEFVLLLLTFLITLTVGIKEGILLGVLISLLLLVYRTSKPHIAVLGRIRGAPYFKNIQRFSEDTEVYNDILMLRFDGQLYFGNQEYFKNELNRHMAAKGPALKFVILNAEAINYADSSAVQLLRRLILELKEKGVVLVIAGAIGPLRDILYSSGLIHQIGKEYLFVNTFEAFNFCKNAGTKSNIQDRVATQSKNSAYVT